jgi:hypothetical protein
MFYEYFGGYIMKIEDFFSTAWEKIIDWIKDPWILILFFLVTGLINFLPEKYLGILNLNGLVNKHGWISGLIFILTGISLLIFLISKIFYLINKKIYFFKKKKRLRNLTLEEKKVLGKYIYFQERTLKFNIDDNDIIKELYNEKFVRHTATTGHMFSYPFTIKKWVYEYLNKNKDLVEFTEEELENRNCKIRNY